MRSQNEPALRDRIYRAAGTMKSAYLIDTSEAVQCISDVLIGLQMGFLSGMDAQKLYTLEEHIHAIEHVLYPEVVQMLADGRVHVLESGKVAIDAPRG